MSSITDNPNTELASAIRAYAAEWRSPATRRHFLALARRLDSLTEGGVAGRGSHRGSASDAPHSEPARGAPLARQILAIIEHAHEELDQKNAVRRGLRYPLWIGIFAMVIVLTMKAIVPVFDLQSLMQMRLPRLLEAMSNMVPIIAFAILALGLAIRLGVLRLVPQIITDRIPIVGKLLRATSRAQFLQLLSGLVANGEPIESAVQIAGSVNPRRSIRRAAQRWSQDTPTGREATGFSTTFHDFPSAVEMALRDDHPPSEKAEFLATLANCQRLRSGDAWRDVAAVSEPVAILLVGGVILVFAMIQFLPLIQLLHALS